MYRGCTEVILLFLPIPELIIHFSKYIREGGSITVDRAGCVYVFCTHTHTRTHTVVYMSRFERRREMRLQEPEQQQQSVSLHARTKIMDDFFFSEF